MLKIYQSFISSTIEISVANSMYALLIVLKAGALISSLRCNIQTKKLCIVKEKNISEPVTVKT